MYSTYILLPGEWFLLHRNLFAKYSILKIKIAEKKKNINFLMSTVAVFREEIKASAMNAMSTLRY